MTDTAKRLFVLVYDELFKWENGTWENTTDDCYCPIKIKFIGTCYKRKSPVDPSKPFGKSIYEFYLYACLDDNLEEIKGEIARRHMLPPNETFWKDVLYWVNVGPLFEGDNHCYFYKGFEIIASEYELQQEIEDLEKYFRSQRSDDTISFTTPYGLRKKRANKLSAVKKMTSAVHKVPVWFWMITISLALILLVFLNKTFLPMVYSSIADGDDTVIMIGTIGSCISGVVGTILYNCLWRTGQHWYELILSVLTCLGFAIGFFIAMELACIAADLIIRASVIFAVVIIGIALIILFK